MTIKGMLLFCWALLPFGEAVSQLNSFLCKPNEEIVYSFLTKSRKRVTICKDSADKYIVYRFGTKEKVELEFPEKPDSTSWKQFSFRGYSRGGGKQNAAMSFAFLSFQKGTAEYELYETWNSEDDRINEGIFIRDGAKETAIKAVLKTVKGSLLSLLYSDKIKTEDELDPKIYKEH